MGACYIVDELIGKLEILKMMSFMKKFMLGSEKSNCKEILFNFIVSKLSKKEKYKIIAK
jgi:hypothetical protein